MRNSIITESPKSIKATQLDSINQTIDDGILLHSKSRSVPKTADGATNPQPGRLKNEEAIDNEGVMNFAVIIGKADNMTSIKQQQELIYKILHRASFPMQNDKLHRLVITGFSNKKMAEEAFQKLLKNGLKGGYILPYKVKFTKLVPI
ncbi:hypothetical protein WG906_04285 [Pedobacter sp. P351]|uniref:hypothetical protein n=1 Tax=Pedobacter superstes TaxID=3133441 RepID=UPI0030A40073